MNTTTWAQMRADEFAEATALLANTLGKPSQPGILSHLRISLPYKGAAVLVLTTTDLETQWEQQIALEGAGDEPWTVYVAADQVSSVAQRLDPGASLTLTCQEHNLHLQSGAFEAVAVGLAVETDEYPRMDLDEAVATAVVEAQDITMLLQATRHCCNWTDTRPWARGIRIEIASESLSMVATDTYRLGLRRVAATTDNEGRELDAFVVPEKPLGILGKGIAKLNLSQQVQLTLGKQVMTVLTGEGRQFWAKLTDSEYPNYQKVMPEFNPRHARCQTSDLLHAVQRTAAFSYNEGLHERQVRIIARPGKLTLITRYHGHLGAEETIDADYEGPKISLTLRSQYLADALKAIGQLQVYLSLPDNIRIPVGIASEPKQFGQSEAQMVMQVADPSEEAPK